MPRILKNGNSNINFDRQCLRLSMHWETTWAQQTCNIANDTKEFPIVKMEACVLALPFSASLSSKAALTKKKKCVFKDTQRKINFLLKNAILKARGFFLTDSSKTNLWNDSDLFWNCRQFCQSWGEIAHLHRSFLHECHVMDGRIKQFRLHILLATSILIGIFHSQGSLQQVWGGNGSSVSLQYRLGRAFDLTACSSPFAWKPEQCFAWLIAAWRSLYRWRHLNKGGWEEIHSNRNNGIRVWSEDRLWLVLLLTSRHVQSNENILRVLVVLLANK